MQGKGTDWGSLSEDQQKEKLQAINELLAKNGLNIKAIAQEHVVCPLKSGSVQNQAFLQVEGNVKSDKADIVAGVTKEIKQTILAGVNPQTCQIEIESKLGAGDNYVQINGVVDINTKNETNIVHKEGQVFLIDFWATWCPPCQAPMAHNQHMLEHHEKDWAGKVRIIGVSIDQGVEAVVKHVKAKGWEKVEHFHRAGSSADEDYGVRGVPHVVLIDTHGKIAYAGHPASRELEKDIETLLKGEALKGVSSGDDESDESGFTVRELSDVKKETSRFADEVKKLMAESNVKTNTASLMRDFVVLVRETYYDAEKKAFLTKLENINVLVGNKSSVDAVKSSIEKFLGDFKGSFKTNWRVQAQ